MSHAVISASFHAWQTVHLSCNVLRRPQICTEQYVLWHDLSESFQPDGSTAAWGEKKIFSPLCFLRKAFTSTLQPDIFILEDFANLL